jgi:hypothetical protein
MSIPRIPVISRALGLDSAVLVSHDDGEVSQNLRYFILSRDFSQTFSTSFPSQTILAALAGTSLQLLHVGKGGARPGAVLLHNVTAVAASPHCR